MSGLPVLQATPRRRLRALTGADEAMLDPDDPLAATALLGRLLASEADVDALAVDEHDRLLAEVFTTIYGDRVEARATCASCREPLEISMSLAAFVAATLDTEVVLAGPDPDGTFTLSDGRRIRPPTIGDVRRSAAAGDAAALRRACVVAGDAEADPDAIDAALEAAAPALTRDVAAVCPHCAAAQSVRFDLTAFLVASIARERPFLLRETHLLAHAYGWSHAEILALPRDDRRTLARLCEGERAASRRAA